MDGLPGSAYSLPAMIAERPVTLSTADGVPVEARLAVPDLPAGAMVVAHPHPLYGGDMDNPVVVRVAEVCRQRGWATVRFIFRGVGRSGGTHDEGRGERRDVEAAWLALAGAVPPGTPLALAGYSFGATVVAAAATGRGGEPPPAGLLLVAPPLALGADGTAQALQGFAAPVLVVAGDRDEYCPPARLAELVRALPRVEVRTVPGANHFFFGRLYPLGEMVGDWIARLEAGQAGRRGAAG